MKALKITYWITTVLFAAFMIFTAVPNEQGAAYIQHLGYPLYFATLLSIVKVLGSATILIPKLGRLKEWAYAGLFFDLFAAVYSIAMVDGLGVDGMFILLPFVLGGVSYYCWRKLEKMRVIR